MTVSVMIMKRENVKCLNILSVYSQEKSSFIPDKDLKTKN
jgi:hypothetical protein